ncbi:MAG TPA: hypothetical protein VGR81_09320 [Candidatus Acidoferrales bacterium]|nr:hypothetical protein [Candidatus Acidoferrales bacterium]
MFTHFKYWKTILSAALLWAAMPGSLHAQMNPYFTTINYPVGKGRLMLMVLPDFQRAREGNNFFTGMLMAEYGITPRWTAGFMVEGQKIFGMPVTYGGLRVNTYFHLLPHERLLNLTLYGEIEDLNQAALYKMEVSGFGPEDLAGPLSTARNTPARTFEQRLIAYHDWGRLNATFNFINETSLEAPHDNDFGYAVGLFRQPASTAMSPMTGMASAPQPRALSVRRLGYGVEMIGALGNTDQFGLYWHRQQQYLGPVLTYDIARYWSVRLEPAFGLSDVSDPFVLRMGVQYSFDGFGHKLGRLF